MTPETGRETQVFGVGITGLIGSRIVELLSYKYQFTNLSLETGVDITNPLTLEVIRKKDGQAIVLHLAAKADVDGCEKDKALGINGDAWKINVEGTRNVVDACVEGGKKVVYISTDFVFDGEKDNYSEGDTPNPTNWYAKTKLEGEKIVTNSSASNVIIRLAYPYRAKFDLKLDFVRAILKKLSSGEKVSAVEDHIMTPTYIDDIALAFDKIIESNGKGIYHVVGSQAISPYDACILMARIFGYRQSLISKVKREDFFKGRASRPFKLHLLNDKISQLGVSMKTFEEGLREVKKQME